MAKFNLEFPSKYSTFRKYCHYLHNTSDKCFAQTLQIQIFEAQIDRNRTISTLCNINAIDSKWLQWGNSQARMSIWMLLNDFSNHSR